MTKGKKIILSVLGVAGVGGLAYALYSLYGKKESDISQNEIKPTQLQSFEPVVVPKTQTVTSNTTQNSTTNSNLSFSTTQTIKPTLQTNYVYNTPNLIIPSQNTATIPQTTVTNERLQIIDKYRFTSEAAKEKFLRGDLPLTSYCEWESDADYSGWSSYGWENNENGCVL